MPNDYPFVYPLIKGPTLYNEQKFISFWFIVMIGEWYDCYLSEEIKEMVIKDE
jgi:hypothetical protein